MAPRSAVSAQGSPRRASRSASAVSSRRRSASVARSKSPAAVAASLKTVESNKKDSNALTNEGGGGGGGSLSAYQVVEFAVLLVVGLYYSPSIFQYSSFLFDNPSWPLCLVRGGAAFRSPLVLSSAHATHFVIDDDLTPDLSPPLYLPCSLPLTKERV